jgi:two-component system chemotaxis sensor kinase CheA
MRASPNTSLGSLPNSLSTNPIFKLNCASMDQTQLQFIADARDIVDRLYGDLEQLRVLRLQGRQRRELAARIFRHVHTLKGSAGSLGLKAVSEVAHEFEGVLDGVRLGRVAIDDELLNLFEDAIDAMAQALGETSSADLASGQALIGRLHSIASVSRQQGAIAGSLRAALPEDIARSLSEYDVQHAREAVREGAKLFIVEAGFALETFDTQFRDLTRLLGKTGEVIATVPGRPATADKINFRLLYAAALVTEELKRRASEFGAIEFAEIRIEAGEAGARTPTEGPTAPMQTVTSVTSVRVGLSQLDDLTSAVTDLLRDTTNALSALQKSAGNASVESANSNLRRRFVQLEERLIKLRLVPLSHLLQAAAARAGRVAARQLGKDIEFEIIGGDVGIDKSLADIVAEPLIHLVRNAVSHGIEAPEQRNAAGKPANGSVTLRGFSEGSRIYISVTDDGRGIDLTRVATAATEDGIVKQPEDLTADQCLRLIFRPGFSTASEASDLSGRGIGLEIVDRAMEQAGGEVRVVTEPGQGATFAMMIPATLALVPCVVVRSGEQFYCFDSAIVADRASVPEDQLAAVKNGQQITWQGEELPVLRLRELLAESDTLEGNGSCAMLICKPSEHRHTVAAHQNRVAVVVDAIAGQQETLVRSLGPHSTRWQGISGAAELLDGSVALMVDLAGLIEANERS